MKDIIKFISAEELGDVKFTFAILIAKHQGNWVFVRHRDRDTWELPAGHVETGEHVDDAAKRELVEETGAKVFTIKPLISYMGYWHGEAVYGKIFEAEIDMFGDLPESEIGEVKLFEEIPGNLTYPEVQPEFLKWYTRQGPARHS